MKTKTSSLVGFQGPEILFYIVLSLVGVIVTVALALRKRG